jgi:alkylhydroperoxidase family enzyme
MTEPRLAPIPRPYAPAIEKALAALMPPGVEPLRLFRTLAHNPRVLERFLAGGLLDKGSLSLRDRELAILRTCARCGSEYEWGVHVAFFSVRAGLSAEEVRATCAREPALRGFPRDRIAPR